MEKFLVKKKIAKNIREAKALLLLFAICCFILSGYFFNKTFGWTERNGLAFNETLEEILLP